MNQTIEVPGASSIDALPNIVPVFPLEGVILLPGRELALHIFEPRYVAMLKAAMESHRMIGMVQPRPDSHKEGAPKLFDVGGAGRITEVEEVEPGRFDIVLTGISRFSVIEEVAMEDGYRRVLVDWHRFAQDLRAREPFDLDSEEVVGLLGPLFEAQGLEVEWHGMDKVPGSLLVDVLAMNLPFPPEDKQAMLEAPKPEDRYKVMQALASMYTHQGGTTSVH